jgi:protein-disulfide isomerase
MRLFVLPALAAVLLAARCGESQTAGAAPASSSPSSAGAPARVDTTHRNGGDASLARRADHARIQGSPQATVWVVEVSDFQCPYCKRWHDETYPEIVRAYVDSGKVRLAYVNFPLAMHKNAWPAAEAAMCAAAQDKFWPMHDALFTTQQRWEGSATPNTTFDSLASSIGLEMTAYKSCIAGHLMRATIQGDIDRAEQQSVESTPTFLIGGAMIAGAQPTPVFRQAIDAALARAARQGTSPR